MIALAVTHPWHVTLLSHHGKAILASASGLATLKIQAQNKIIKRCCKSCLYVMTLQSSQSNHGHCIQESNQQLHTSLLILVNTLSIIVDNDNFTVSLLWYHSQKIHDTV